MAFCEQCGAELSEGAKFCTACGTAVKEKTAEKAAEKTAETVEKAEEKETVENVTENSEVVVEAKTEDTAGPTPNPQSQPNQQSNSQYQQYQQPVNDMRKSRTLAGILGIIFGCFGVHNFYLGYTAKAVIQLCVSILGLLLCCVGIGVFIITGIAIWGLVEGIMILAGSINVDGKGVPLKD